MGRFFGLHSSIERILKQKNMAKGNFEKNGRVISGRVLREDGLTIINPTVEQLAEHGWSPVVQEAVAPDRVAERMAEIEAELASLDYLTSKYVDGEDMSEYGDWQGRRRALREEYRALEKGDVVQ